ncbi:intracellular proteinase inhibitor domain protein [Shewanella halifaxensis HAW-EB4]|uniref:Intracellular proteinase inhibitor domain protein n=1 Tax=Shewanella halifaxensis (strain HAW-EB4) TaxID=458817 RepID=B0TRL6_SHEHH|nr:BsuPI-related putative proteinase inhibitor [Shewanella halifaxensis]ABZ76434.1 intracellular proteinase inhibitor domain protein [Shewanella halifaxensis HAW-EB4]
MLNPLLLSLAVFGLMGCSSQQAEAAKVETTTTPKTLPSQIQQPQVQPIKVLPTGIVGGGSAGDRVSIKDKAMSQGLLDAKLVVTDKANITLQYTNNQSYGVPLMFASGMTADLWLLDPTGHKVWAWSNEMMFTQALRETVMPAGKTQNVKFTIPTKVAAKITKGYSLKAIFAGRATESQSPAMLPVTYYY